MVRRKMYRHPRSKHETRWALLGLGSAVLLIVGLDYITKRKNTV